MCGPFRMTLIHPVPDFERYRAVSQENLAATRPGLLRRSVFRSIDDPNEVMIEFEFESAEAATAFLPSFDLDEVFERVGLELYPPVFIGQEIDELHWEREEDE